MVKLEIFTPFAVFKPSEEPPSDKPKYRTETYLSLIKEKETFIHNLQNKKCKCIGAVIMLNPGSSKPEESEFTWRDGGIVKAKADSTMEQIEKCVKMAYEIKRWELKGTGYIEIFNLFNLCESKSQKAIDEYKKDKNKQFMTTTNLVEKIKDETPWIWIAWRCNNDKCLDKERERIYDGIARRFSGNIMIKIPCKNNKYGFWHPFQHGNTKNENVRNKLGEYISNLLKQQQQILSSILSMIK